MPPAPRGRRPVPAFWAVFILTAFMWAGCGQAAWARSMDKTSTSRLNIDGNGRRVLYGCLPAERKKVDSREYYSRVNRHGKIWVTLRYVHEFNISVPSKYRGNKIRFLARCNDPYRRPARYSVHYRSGRGKRLKGGRGGLTGKTELDIPVEPGHSVTVSVRFEAYDNPRNNRDCNLTCRVISLAPRRKAKPVQAPLTKPPPVSKPATRPPAVSRPSAPSPPSAASPSRPSSARSRSSDEGLNNFLFGLLGLLLLLGALFAFRKKGRKGRGGVSPGRGITPRDRPRTDAGAADDDPSRNLRPRQRSGKREDKEQKGPKVNKLTRDQAPGKGGRVTADTAERGPSIKKSYKQPDSKARKEPDRDRAPKVMELTSSLKVLRPSGPRNSDISVRVMDLKMQPVPGVEVELRCDQGHLTPDRGVSDAQGRIAARWGIGDQPRGKVKIAGSCPAHRLVRDFKYIEYQEERPRKLEITPRGEPRVRADGQDSCELMITVTGPEAEPAARVSIKHEVKHGGRLNWKHGSNQTGRDGEVMAVYTGPSREEASEEGARPEIVVWVEGYEEVRDSQWIELIRQIPSSVELSLEPRSLPADGTSRCRVTGLVRGEEGEAMGGVEFGFGTDPQPMAQRLAARNTTTDMHGRAEVDFTMPARCDSDTIIFTGFVTDVEGNFIEARAELVVEAKLELAVEFDQRQMDADGRDREELTAVVTKAGKPAAGVMVEAIAPEPKAGKLEPDALSTDDRGRAQFTYTASEQPGRFTLRLSLRDCIEQTLEQTVEQVEAHYYQVALDDVPGRPVVRVYLRPSAEGRHQALAPEDVRQVRIMTGDLSADHAGPPPPEGYRVAALVGRVGFGPEDWPQYQRQAREFTRIAKVLRIKHQELTELRGREFSERHKAVALEALAEAYSVAGLFAGWTNMVGAANSLSATLLSAWSDAVDYLSQAVNAYDHLVGKTKRPDWTDLHEQWSALAHRETEAVYGLWRQAEAMSRHWLELGPNQAALDGWQVLTSDEGLWGDSEAGRYWHELINLLEVQQDRGMAALRALEPRAEELERHWPGEERTRAFKDNLQRIIENITEAGEEADQVTQARNQALEEARMVEALARTLENLRRGPT